jgi:hypothetical protein
VLAYFIGAWSWRTDSPGHWFNHISLSKITIFHWSAISDIFVGYSCYLQLAHNPFLWVSQFSPMISHKKITSNCDQALPIAWTSDRRRSSLSVGRSWRRWHGRRIGKSEKTYNQIMGILITNRSKNM